MRDFRKRSKRNRETSRASPAEEIRALFGAVKHDPAYDYKKQRRKA